MLQDYNNINNKDFTKFNIILLFSHSICIIVIIMTNNPKIFTFWEPKGKMPAYIQLCMQTWRKFLPEYEIIVVDYSNIDKYLGKNFYDEILYKDFRLMLQADAIRCALLKLYGGIWIDADTIITSTEVNNYLKNSTHKLVFIGQHLAFIKADKLSPLLNYWLKKIKYRIEFYKTQKYRKNKLKSKIEHLFHLRLFKIMNSWDYFGNSIIGKNINGNIIFRISRKIKNKLNFPVLYNYLTKRRKILSIDRIEINALPEIIGKKNTSQENLIRNYQNFYFENDYSQEVIKNTKGIILLHNSWTPQKYKEMTKEEFLSQNNTLSNVLKTILTK